MTKEYEQGYDAGKNGPNTTNSNFSLFATPEQTDEWECGNAKGIEARWKEQDKINN